MKTIAIVGSGFSGTMVAVNLARLSRAPLRVSVINRGSPAGRGVAYSTPRPEHLLNVVALNMSAFPDHPGHLLDWLRTRTEYADTPEAELRGTFIPRRLYGDYLRSVALPYQHPVDPRLQTSLEPIEGEAVDVKTTDTGGTVLLADGTQVAADRIVLALGNQPPAQLPGAESLTDHPAYCPNPWQPWLDRLPPSGGKVVLLGTGLTAVDAILTLLASGWKGTIHAVSRHGLLPQSHFKGIEYPGFPPDHPESLGLKKLKVLMEEHCAQLKNQGANPAIIVDKLRPHTQRIWQQFSAEEKHAFCTGEAARWNVIRHRIAPQIHRQISNALDDEILKVVPGTIESLQDSAPTITVSLEDGTSLDGDFVINCTGPMTRFSKTPMPLIQNLLAGGLVQPDEMDMGLRVADDFAAMDAANNRSRLIYAMGPLLRGTLWETIAVPELRGQALRIASTLLAELEPGAKQESAWPSHEEEAVMEYMI